MNKENNQRFKDTEDKIRKAYTHLAGMKDPDQITVTDICRYAEIHRTTFYGHFQDIPDLRNYMIQYKFQELISHYLEEGSHDLKEAVFQQVMFYYRNRRIIKRVLEKGTEPSDGQRRRNLKGHVDHSGREWSSEQLSFFTRSIKCKSKAEQEYVLAFYESGFLEVLRHWILADCPETPEEIAHLLCVIFGLEKDSFITE